jgi:hypothetical protein
VPFDSNAPPHPNGESSGSVANVANPASNTTNEK